MVTANDLNELNATETGSIKFGTGELTDGYQYQVLLQATRMFLDVLIEEAPEVMEDLQREPLTVARQIWPCRDEQPDSVTAELLDRLNALIRDWRKRWRLGNDQVRWIDSYALPTLVVWAGQAALGEPLTARFADSLASRPEFTSALAQLYDLPPEFALQVNDALHWYVLPFPPAAWNPREETRAAATDRIIGGLRSHLSMLMDKVEHRQRHHVGDITPLLKPSGRIHFRWFVRYQVKGESLGDIAKAVYAAPQTVADAISRIEQLINLPRRPPGRPGRKPILDRL